MAITIEEFIKTASDEQKRLFGELYDISEQSKNLQEHIQKVYLHLGADINRTYTFLPCGRLEDEAARMLTLQARAELIDFDVRLKELFIKGVDIGMGELGIIQRNYEAIVGEKLK